MKEARFRVLPVAGQQDVEYAREIDRRLAELREPEVREFVSHLMFDAMLGGPCPKNHELLEGGVAPADWPGWQDLLPPLGPGCCCCLIGITRAHARRLVAEGKGFDLLKGIPDGAGADPGWVRP